MIRILVIMVTKSCFLFIYRTIVAKERQQKNEKLVVCSAHIMRASHFLFSKQMKNESCIIVMNDQSDNELFFFKIKRTV